MAMALCDANPAEAMICQITPELIHLDIFDFYGNQMSLTEMDMPNLVKRQIEQLKHRASVRPNNSLTTRSLLWKAARGGRPKNGPNSLWCKT